MKNITSQHPNPDPIVSAIVEKMRSGIDITESESSEIKQYMKQWSPVLLKITIFPGLFPLEYAEVELERHETTGGSGSAENYYTFCKCNNCESVMYEPSAGDKAVLISEADIQRMENDGYEFLGLEHFTGIAPSEPADDNDVFEDTGFYGCPVCKDDGYLADIESIDQFPKPKFVSIKRLMLHAAELTDSGLDRNDEYVRGILELIAFCDMRGTADTDVRIEQIKQELLKYQTRT